MHGAQELNNNSQMRWRLKIFLEGGWGNNKLPKKPIAAARQSLTQSSVQ